MKSRAIAMSIIQVVWVILSIIFLVNHINFSEPFVYSEYLNGELGYVTYVFKGGVLTTVLWAFAIWGIAFIFAAPKLIFDASGISAIILGVAISIYVIVCLFILFSKPMEWYLILLAILFLLVVGLLFFGPVGYYVFFNLNLESLGLELIILFSVVAMLAWFIFSIAFLFHNIIAGIIAAIILVATIVWGLMSYEPARETLIVFIFRK